MGIKKKCRELNKIKNKFVEWLKINNAENIDIYEGEDDIGEWDYYRCVSAFIGDTLHTVYFTMWHDVIKIDYSDEENRYKDMSVDDFKHLIW
jgi:hypothetical protein